MLVTLQALAGFPEQLAAYYAAVPPAYRNWVPPSWQGVPSEPFTAIEHICHVRDIEVDGYQLRLRRTLAEDDPLLLALDGEALARERHYAKADTTAVLTDFRRARGETLALLESLHPEQLRRPARFADYGALTLASLVHYLCSHDQQHLAGLQWLLGRIAAAEIHSQGTPA